MIDLIQENKLIIDLTKKFKRSPYQLNGVQQSDAEILLLPNGLNNYIALTTDSIVEEIELGLYDDPYLIGWMIVMVNMSDLAAVGASPLGILISEILPANFPKESLMKMQDGINDACKICNTFVLGGDTNYGRELQLTGTALGIVKKKPLSRVGCNPGDLLYSSGVLGNGNAYALTKLINKNTLKHNYRPRARIKEGEQLLDFANSCMDTSDGVIATLDQLMRLNNVGFELYENWESILDSGSKEIAKNFNLPYWLLLAGLHGEFELIFTIPQDKRSEFEHAVSDKNWNPLIIGKVISEPKIDIHLYNKMIAVYSEHIRNLSYKVNSDISSYLESLLKIDKKMHQSA